MISLRKSGSVMSHGTLILHGLGIRCGSFTLSMVRSVTAEICATGLLSYGGNGSMAHISHNVLRGM